MRNRLLAALGVCALSASLCQAGAPAQAEDAAALIANLGSDDFTEREIAARKLERLGAAALSQLQSACKSSDPEVRRRAAGLVERIERAAESARLLTAAPITLNYKDMPLGTAIADFRARTTIPVQLDSDGVANPLRPITVKTDALPPWQALEAFCKAAGLKEVFLPELPLPKMPTNRYSRRGYYPQTTPTPPSAKTVPVTLADGVYASLPGERGRAIRVLALPHRFASNRLVLGSGEVTLHLDVAPLPGQNWQDILGVRVRQALDAHGRTVPVSHRVELLPLAEDYEGNVVVINGRMAMWNGGNIDDPNGRQIELPNPRLVPLTLRTGDSGIRSLRVLEGDVQIEITLPDQPLLTVVNLGKAAQSSYDAPNQAKLTIADIHPEPNRPDQTTIKLRLEWPSPWMVQQMKMQRGAANVMPMLAFIDPPIAPSQGPQFQIYGEDGKVLSTSSTTYSSGQTDDGMRLFSEIGLTVRSKSPAKLVMVGPKTVTVDVPFHMENVQLP